MPDREPDIIILRDKADSNTDSPIAPLGMLYTKEPDPPSVPLLGRILRTIFGLIVLGVVFLFLFEK